MSWSYAPKRYPLRVPGSERAYVNLGIGAAWLGQPQAWGDLPLSLRIKLKAALQGTIWCMQGPVASLVGYDPTAGASYPTVAAPDGVQGDVWNVPAATGVATPYRFPLARRVGAQGFLLALKQGAGAGNVGLEETVLDPRPVDADLPLVPVVDTPIVAGANVPLAIPPGTRATQLCGIDTNLTYPIYWQRIQDAAGANLGPSLRYLGPSGVPEPRRPLPQTIGGNLPAIFFLQNTGAVNAVYWVSFFPG